MNAKITRQCVPGSDDAAAELLVRIKATCDRYGVQQRELCTNAFLGLAAKFRQLLKPNYEIEGKTHTQLKKLRDATSRLNNVLQSLDEDSLALIPEFLTKEMPLHKLFCESLHSVSKQLTTTEASKNFEVHELIAKQFIVICQQFRIPIKWGKAFECHSINSKNEPSAYLLGAIYAAGGMNVDSETTPASCANYYLGRFSKGFTVDIDGDVVRVLLNKTMLEPNPFLSQVLGAILNGSTADLSTCCRPQASCKGSELGLSRPFGNKFNWHC